MVQIHYIYADNCKHCKEALSTIESAILKCKNIPCEIIKFRYDSKAALAIARNNGIDDLPGFVINGIMFKGDNYTEQKIIDAIKDKV